MATAAVVPTTPQRFEVADDDARQPACGVVLPDLVAGFDGEPQAFLEAITAQVRIGPIWTPHLTLLVLRLGDDEIRRLEANYVPHGVLGHS